MAHRLCPVWVGYLLASPIRKLRQNPRTILAPFVRPGMTVIDVGSAMGFFSIPLAEAVGPLGRVVCLDVQERMLARLEKRARRAGVADRIETRRCEAGSLGIGDLSGKVGFALVFAVVHEVPDPERLFAELHAALEPSARALLAEPKGHVRETDWAATLHAARGAGFEPGDSVRVGGARASVLHARGGKGRE